MFQKFDEKKLEYELLFDHSLYATRKPKILLQTCGHVSGRKFMLSFEMKLAVMLIYASIIT